MAAIGPKYERSAVDIISPMLTINQQMAAKNESRWNKIKEGVKGLSSGITEAIGSIMAVNKRKEAIKYLGDDHLKELEAELAQAKIDLTQVENEMRTIKAEDTGSLDVPQNLYTPAENDVDAFNPNGSRTAIRPIGNQDPTFFDGVL